MAYVIVRSFETGGVKMCFNNKNEFDVRSQNETKFKRQLIKRNNKSN